ATRALPTSLCREKTPSHLITAICVTTSERLIWPSQAVCSISVRCSPTFANIYRTLIVQHSTIRSSSCNAMAMLHSCNSTVVLTLHQLTKKLPYGSAKKRWPSTALGFLNSLQVRMEENKRQYDILILRIAKALSLEPQLREIASRLRDRPRDLILELVRVFINAL